MVIRVWARISGVFSRMDLPGRFLLVSLVIILLGSLRIGSWVSQIIEDGVVHQAGATSALYVDSFISPLFQGKDQNTALAPAQIQTLGTLLQDTPLGQQITAFKVWDTRGTLLFSKDREQIGQVFPIHERMQKALGGEVSSEISLLAEAENVIERTQADRLLETYSPISLSGTRQIIAVAEFYQRVDDLERVLAQARFMSWLAVGGVMVAIYLLLAVFVRSTSRIIDRQNFELDSQVKELSRLLRQNQELDERVRRAAASVATLNEGYLRRIGAELHDGPAQELALSVLRLDRVIRRAEKSGNGMEGEPGGLSSNDELLVIESLLQNTLNEMRTIAAGLSLPQLAGLSLTETLVKAVRAHERRTNSRVNLRLIDLPEQAALPVKITLYRLVQEALNNAFRHADGKGQEVYAQMVKKKLAVIISDQGPGFDPEVQRNREGHLGLFGMRERVESLGGLFEIHSQVGSGTLVQARLNLFPEGE